MVRISHEGCLTRRLGRALSLAGQGRAVAAPAAGLLWKPAPWLPASPCRPPMVSWPRAQTHPFQPISLRLAGACVFRKQRQTRTDPRAKRTAKDRIALICAYTHREIGEIDQNQKVTRPQNEETQNMRRERREERELPLSAFLPSTLICLATAPPCTPMNRE
jgi:hypothetical protein